MREVIPPNAKLLPPNANRVFKGQIYDVYQWEQELFDGSTGTFEMLKRPDTVKVLAVKDGKIVVLEEEQPYHGTFFDVPGGRHDDASETELQAMQRELREETGMSF
ncbi:MAG TPA: NUDIX hydrolase, partial [Candidatus Saccharimonadia bacterium]